MSDNARRIDRAWQPPPDPDGVIDFAKAVERGARLRGMRAAHAEAMRASVARVTDLYSGGREAPRSMPVHLRQAPALEAHEHVKYGRELLEVLEQIGKDRP